MINSALINYPFKIDRAFEAEAINPLTTGAEFIRVFYFLSAH